MSQKQPDFYDLSLFPLFWLQCPKMGDPIRIPNKPNLILIPMKTPLPSKNQYGIPPEYQWTMELAVETAAKKIGEKRQNIIFISFELTPYGDSTSVEDNYICDVYHEYLPLGTNPEKVLDMIIEKIDNLPSPSYIHAILISCHNGYNRTGYIISGIFMKMLNYTCRASTLLFSKKRPPGIFSQDMIDNLNKIYPDDPPSVKSELPSYIQPFNFKGDDDASLSNLSSITIENTPNFIFNGGHTVKDQNQINELTSLLGSVIPKKGKFRRVNNGGFYPLPFIFTQDRLNKYRSPLKDPNESKITFLPRGANVFLIITQTQNDGFYLSYEADQFFFFRACIGSELPRPIICTAIYSTRNNDPVIFVTDVLSFGELYMEFADPENRFKCLWYFIIPNIKVLAPSQNLTETNNEQNTQLVKIAYRPLTRLKFCLTLMNDFDNYYLFDGIPCDGAVIIDRNYPVGGFLFIPLKPSFIVLFIMNGPKDAILYVRSDDDAHQYQPIAYFDISNSAQLVKLNRKFVRFEVVRIDNRILLKPISICKNAQCDYFQNAKNVLEFISGQISGFDILKQLKLIVSKK